MRPLIALTLALGVGACFPPDLGDGMVACGLNSECPPNYSCHANDRKCWKARDVVVGDLAMSMPSDMAGADLAGVDLAGADLAHCTTLSCGSKDCGTTPDGCGGIMSCGNACPTLQVCGGGGNNPNVCGVGVCTAKTCTKNTDCGIISDGCSATLDCGGCNGNKTCGGGGPNLCG